MITTNSLTEMTTFESLYSQGLDPELARAIARRAPPASETGHDRWLTYYTRAALLMTMTMSGGYGVAWGVRNAAWLSDGPQSAEQQQLEQVASVDADQRAEVLGRIPRLVLLYCQGEAWVEWDPRCPVCSNRVGSDAALFASKPGDPFQFGHPSCFGYGWKAQ